MESFEAATLTGEMGCFSKNWILQRVMDNEDIGVSENSGTPISSILIGFSVINHPFWGTPIFGNTHILFMALVVKDVDGSRKLLDIIILVAGPSKYNSVQYPPCLTVQQSFYNIGMVSESRPI